MDRSWADISEILLVFRSRPVLCQIWHVHQSSESSTTVYIIDVLHQPNVTECRCLNSCEAINIFVNLVSFALICRIVMCRHKLAIQSIKRNVVGWISYLKVGIKTFLWWRSSWCIRFDWIHHIKIWIYLRSTFFLIIRLSDYIMVRINIFI